MLRHIARLIGGCVCVAAALAPMAAAPPEVRTDTGAITGVPGRSAGVRVFKGIPYAAPPVGPLRWRPPQPVAPWTGVRQAREFGPRCMQPPGDAGGRASATQPMSEDCLYLNVWAPADSRATRLPVIVWAHGGAFMVGAGSLPDYDGEVLARKGVIVVTINYRLGPFGFLAHPELTRESGRRASGNYGLMDFVAALEWVQKNITAFNGDPGRVTVMGQSAGGALILYAVASNRIPQLFTRAIVQSYPVRIDPFLSLADAERVGQQRSAQMGAGTLAALRAKTADEVQRGMVGPRPNVDGWYLSEDVWVSLAQGRLKNVDLLIGSNKDEGTFPYLRAAQMGLGAMRASEFTDYVKARFGANADAFFRLYPAGSDAEAATSQLAAFRDEASWSERLWAGAHARRGRAKAFLYHFVHEPPVAADQPNRRATHTAEIPYVFNVPGPLWADRDRRLAETMSSYWANFAKAADPNGPDLPQWPSLEPGKNERQMVLGATIGAGATLDTSRVALFDALLPHLVPQAADRSGAH